MYIKREKIKLFTFRPKGEKMRIIALTPNQQNSNLNCQKPSFKAIAEFTPEAEEILSHKIHDFFIRLQREGETRDFFPHGEMPIKQSIENFKKALTEWTSADKEGVLFIDKDPESEGFLKIAYQSPNKKVLQLGSISPHEILPNQNRDGGKPFGNIMKTLIKNISNAIMSNGTKINYNNYYELYEKYGESGSSLLSKAF